MNATRYRWNQIEERIGDNPVVRAHAGALLRFAADVLHFDTDRASSWVVSRAVGNAMREVRDLFDDGEDMNTTDAAMAAVELWLGIAGVKATLAAGELADQIGTDEEFTLSLFGCLRKAADIIDPIGDRVPAA